MRLARSAAATALALSLAALCLPDSADAGRRHWRHGGHGHYNNGAAAFLGFGAGLILGGALASPYYGYREPAYGYGYPYGGGYYRQPYYGGYAYPPPVIYRAPPAYYAYPRPYYGGGYYGDELGYGD